MSRRCKVMKNARGQVLKPHWAMKGQEVCGAHGGRAPQNKRAAANRLAKEAALAEAAALADITGESGRDEHPIEHLVRRLYHARRMTEVLGKRVAVLDETDELVQENHITKTDVTHPLLVEYGTWCDRQVKYAKVCLDAGVQEREVRIAEQQAALVVEAFQRAISDGAWSLTAEQKEKGLKIFGKHLRLVESA